MKKRMIIIAGVALISVVSIMTDVGISFANVSRETLVNVCCFIH